MLTLRRPRPRLHGFTVLEISTALALVAVFSLIAFPAWRAIERSADNRAARLTLRSLEPEVARVIIASDGEVPGDIAARMRVGGLTLGDGTAASTDADTVSVAPLSGSADRAVLTVLADSGWCWVMSSTVDASPRWAVDETPAEGACRAAEPSITAGTVTGSEDAPSQLNLTSAWVPPEPEPEPEPDPTTTTTPGPTTSTSTTTTSTTTTTVPLNPAYASVVLGDSPVGYWRLGDSGGGGADSSGSGRHGAYTNVTLGQPGALSGSDDTAASFGAQTNSQLVVPGAAAFSGAELTVEAWVKTTSSAAGEQGIVSNEVSSKGTAVYLADGHVHASYTRSAGNHVATVSSPAPINDGGFHHVVYTVDSGGSKLYVDGAHVATGAWSGTAGAHSSMHPLRIGNHGGAKPFSGVIDEVAVYDSVLSPSQVTAHHSAGLDTHVEEDPGAVSAAVPYAATVLTDAPLGYWRFDDSSGSTVTDSSGWGRHAALSGTYNRSHSGVPGSGGLSYSFNGGYATPSGTPASVTTANTNVTLECWVYVPVGASSGSCLKLGSTNGYGLGVGTNFDTPNGLVYALYEQVRWIATNSSFTYGWNHLVLVLNGTGKPTVYVNGAAVYSDTAASPTAPSGQSTGGVGGYIPNATYNRTFKDLNVRVDEVAVYSSALSAARIAAHYEAGVAAMLPTPAAPTVTSTTSNSVSLSWSAPAGEVTGYRVYRNSSTTPIYTGSATTFTDTGRAANTEYTYRVVAYGPTGDSRTSAGVVGKTKP